MIKWLPSESRWIDELADRALTGEILVVRAARGWGLSELATSLVSRLGDSAVLVNGRSFTEENQRNERDALRSKLERVVGSEHCAQLIFDDYGFAIRRSQGGTLHSMLYGLLVDSGVAADIGAVLIARIGDTIDLNLSGSPLLSRAQTMSLPTIGKEDAAVLGIDLQRIRDRVGDGTWLARRISNSRDLSSGELDVVQHLNFSARSIVESLPYPSVEVLAGARRYCEADLLSREALRLFGSVPEGGDYVLGSLVSQSTLLDVVHIESPGWPSNFEASVKRFAELVAGASDCLWVDRYLFSDPQMARKFVDRLRSYSYVRIKFLVSGEKMDSGLKSEIQTAFHGLSNVVVKFMTNYDRRLLHDRHLIISSSMTGFNLPTARVIFGVDDPGSAVVSKLPAFAIDYSECWGRAAPVFKSG